MTPQIKSWVKRARKSYIKKPGRVLEIGSKDITGHVRDYFLDAKEYIGIDGERGFNVDLVMDAHDILKRFKNESFDTVLCFEMLEHDNSPWITIDNMYKALKKGGFLIVSTPTFGFPLHRHPKDYFRYGEDAFREIIFKNLKVLRLDEVKDSEGNPAICCIGQKL